MNFVEIAKLVEMQLNELDQETLGGRTKNIIVDEMNWNTFQILVQIGETKTRIIIQNYDGLMK